jgi:Domain of unknown function (DUF4258)
MSRHIRYDEHAKFQLERRGIAKVWVEQTIREPEVTQTSGNRRSNFRCVAGRRIMLWRHRFMILTM